MECARAYDAHVPTVARPPICGDLEFVILSELSCWAAGLRVERHPRSVEDLAAVSWVPTGRVRGFHTRCGVETASV